MNFRIERAEETDNAHVLGTVGHGARAVLFADEIDGDHARIGRGKLEAGQGLREESPSEAMKPRIEKASISPS
jgi:hypothetical protein